jgi:hypothetical protein
MKLLEWDPSALHYVDFTECVFAGAEKSEVAYDCHEDWA